MAKDACLSWSMASRELLRRSSGGGGEETKFRKPGPLHARFERPARILLLLVVAGVHLSRLRHEASRR
ncbi:hypothetical protein E2562_032676 [Oryza meyeriana var. granulata]|uniref:Uncharacterized protein n=1 Tax=Oryza meyeriana var. granulata TaxID=110450 RepID=A0A6G1FEX3_9ORYZ|nr:hypothetical protein E2562_032676 [Oryza meyeriana var. granulata]